MDDLSRIERSYGSVAEYNRSRMEDEEYEDELHRIRDEGGELNRYKLETYADIAIWFSDECVGCDHYEDIGPRFESDWDVDDALHGLCHNCNRAKCPVWQEKNKPDWLVTT